MNEFTKSLYQGINTLASEHKIRYMTNQDSDGYWIEARDKLPEPPEPVYEYHR